MKPILQLENDIELLENSKDAILDRWISFDEVLEVLRAHAIEPSYFVKNFAKKIFDYYVGVVKKETQIGDCPVMAAFLDYLKEHDVSSSELFLTCTHFRKSMLDELFEIGSINKALFDEVSYVFDLNFSGVLDQYSGRIYKAQRETKIHKRRFEEYNLAIDHSAMVCKTDLEGCITYSNSRFSELSGYSTQELLGTQIKNIITDDKELSLVDEMWAQSREKKIFHGIVKNITKDGQEYFIETSIVPMLDLEGKVEEYLSIGYDVSELIRSRDAALSAERSKDQFLANMSHEIRTPLNAILGFVAILKKRSKDEENSRYLDVIDSSGKNLLNIIGDILDFAKIREGKMRIDAHWCNPTKELAEILELFSSKVFEKNIEYLTYIDPFLPLKINIDTVRLKQILTNFLSNALKFTPEKGKISVMVSMQNNKLVISVKDSGCGIEEDAIERVFSAFEQEEGSTTRKYGGTGLGLSICQQLSEMMNGEIEVESKVSQGSLFRLRVPVESSAESNQFTPHDVYLHDSSDKNMQLLKRYIQEMKMPLCEAPSSATVNFYSYDDQDVKVEPYVLVSATPIENEECLTPAFNAYKIMQKIEKEIRSEKDKVENNLRYNGHVLVAEDNSANQMLMRLMLDEYGLSYVLVSNGQEAYDAYKNDKFTLILMDEQMPVMNGLDAAEKIMEYEAKQKLRHTPIISVTANALKGDRERFLEAGMDGYLAKPIDKTKLEELLNKFISGKGENMSQNLQLPSYSNISAEEMAAKIGLNVKHIPILVQSFTEESKSLLEQLEAAIKANNYAEIGNVAHSIKGSSGNLKFVDMYELAKTVELSAKDANQDFPYMAACESLKAAIESISL